MSSTAHVLTSMNRPNAEDYFSSRTKCFYLGERKSICIVLGQYKMYVDTSDVGFSPHMMFDGFWEFWLTKFMADHIRPGDHVMDVGANLGYYTLLMGSLVGPTGSVMSFEPNPAIADLLKSTLTINGFDGRTRFFNAALTDAASKGTLSLFVSDKDPKNATIVAETFVHPTGKTISIQALDINDIPMTRLDFIKIDVEGSEKRILESLQALKHQYAPKIVAEVNFGRRYTYDDIVALIGYKGELLHIDFNSEVMPLTRKMAAEQRHNEDWLVYWPGKT